jgi:Uma2 family endonuclease
VYYAGGAAVHDVGHQFMQTGRVFSGGIEHPHVGCTLGYLKGGRGELPAHVLLPRPIGRTGGNLPHGHTAGYLGKPHDPFILNADPSAPNFKVPDLLPPDYLTAVRADRRQKLRDAIDGATAAFEASPAAKQMDENFKLAYRLLSSAKAREAFALEKEPGKVRDRYGRTRFGQSCLMARRLVEAGVRFVTVNMFETVFDEITWDIHGSRPFTDIQEMSKQVVPNFDQAYSALLEYDRGGDGLVRTDAEDQPGRRPGPPPRGVDDRPGRRPHQGRPGGRRVGRAGVRPEDPAGVAGRGGGDAVPGARAGLPQGAARPAEPADTAGGLRGPTGSRAVLTEGAAMTPTPAADVDVPAFPKDLPFDDGVPMDSPWHRAQMELLIASTEYRWRGRKDFYCGGNMFIHFSEERARNRDFKGPDFFVVLDTDHDRPRQYWAPWDEDGRYPNVIVELLSPTTADEDRTTKRVVYERTFRTPEYFLYDPSTRQLEGYRLARRYRRLEPADGGRLWSDELECWLGVWDGVFDGHAATWLRFFEQDGTLIPTGEEAATVRADAEARRADVAEAELARLKAELAALKQQPPTTP